MISEVKEMTETEENQSFFDRPGVELSQIPVGAGIPLGIERIANPQVGIAGVYGAWGRSYSNETLRGMIADHLGEPFAKEDAMNLSELGFLHRHHIPQMSQAEYVEMEIEAGARFLREAALSNGWQPSEVEGVLIGSSSPIVQDFVDRIAERAGILASAIKVSVHKACDSSVGSLQLALNPNLTLNIPAVQNLARELLGKKVLVGGIEGLSRFLKSTRDKNALQLFGNAAGVIGLIPGQAMKFIVGKTHEAFDGEGVLQVRMDYPHADGAPLLDVTQTGANSIRVAGLMHEPADGSSVVMAGPMGMVKLFVRTGVEVVQDLYAAYQERLADLNVTGKSIAVAIVHHANFKINKLIEKNLQKEGISFPMPWLLNEFGNVSAASNMIAFLRQLPSLNPGDHVLFDGFGAGTYYDALAVELGG
jgi:3-oxoacyl-[acyl-carrier-protein] synthase III